MRQNTNEVHRRSLICTSTGFFLHYNTCFSNNFCSFHSRELRLVSFWNQRFAILYVKILKQSVECSDYGSAANLPSILCTIPPSFTSKFGRSCQHYEIGKLHLLLYLSYGAQHQANSNIGVRQNEGALLKW